MNQVGFSEHSLDHVEGDTITTPLSEMKDKLSAFVRKSTKQDIVITNHGRHVAVLTGFVDEDEYLEYRLLNDPRFQKIISRSRKEASEGKVTRLADLAP